MQYFIGDNSFDEETTRLFLRKIAVHPTLYFVAVARIQELGVVTRLSDKSFIASILKDDLLANRKRTDNLFISVPSGTLLEAGPFLLHEGVFYDRFANVYYDPKKPETIGFPRELTMNFSDLSVLGAEKINKVR